MRYQGYPNAINTHPPFTGVLLVNLGTPDAPTPSALRKYLAEFLADPRVIEFPRLIWRIILHGVILRIRPSRSAKAYQTVWTERGSPLLFHTSDQAAALREQLQAEHGERVQVEFAMRYGNPSIRSVLDKWQAQGLKKLIVLPLYPQYAGPTTGSTFDAVAKEFSARRYVPEIHFISDYHDHPLYISALADSVKKHWQENGRNEHLIMSYHGEPQRYVDQGDPYYEQCLRTSTLLAEALELNQEQYTVTFQSRFGREPWLQPYTDETLIDMARSGRIKSVDVICPGFAADCLETIEEIGVENREYFMENGGEGYGYVGCLNGEDRNTTLTKELVLKNL